MSTVSIHEVFKLSLERDGKEAAKLRVALIEKEFGVVSVDPEVAKSSAELRSRYHVPMADSMIAATAKVHRLRCVTDDPHLSAVREIDVRWI